MLFLHSFGNSKPPTIQHPSMLDAQQVSLIINSLCYIFKTSLSVALKMHTYQTDKLLSSMYALFRNKRFMLDEMSH